MLFNRCCNFSLTSFSYYKQHNLVYEQQQQRLLKTLPDKEAKDLAINFGKFFKSMTEKMYSKLGEEKNHKKIAELFYAF